MKYLPTMLVKKVADDLSNIYERTDECYYNAWLLVEAITNLKKTALLARPFIELTLNQEKKLERFIREHMVAHKPLQYILSEIPFNDLTIFLEPPILIPRPETEEWSFMVCQDFKKVSSNSLTILDLCTGTGCVALTIAKAFPNFEVFGSDNNKNAIALAKKNMRYNNIKNAIFLVSDLYRDIPPNLRFDCIVANPPYISKEDWQSLDPGVRLWEDKKALIAEDDGFEILEKIIQHAPDWLTSNKELIAADVPQIIVEIGHTQAERTASFMSKFFSRVRVHNDINGKERVVLGGR